MIYRLVFLIAVLVSSLHAVAGNPDSHNKVIWQVIENGEFKNYDGQTDGHALYLPLYFNDLRGLKLEIVCPGTFYVFIDGALVSKHKRSSIIDIDSLSATNSRTALLSVYSKSSLQQLKASWVSKEDDSFNPKRETTRFSSFILGVSVLLLIFITALLRTNPQLTQDYLNISKLFILRDRDEGQILRITSSVNLLFYFFCSALAALAMLITSHAELEGVSFLSEFGPMQNHLFWLWIILSVIIFIVMMLKLILSVIFSNLFGWKDLAAIQFFNFIRIVILSLFIIALVSLTAFSFGMDLNYFTLLKIVCLLLVIGAVLIYIKLLARATFHFFHLFFYLCATEVLPLVVIIKILLY